MPIVNKRNRDQKKLSPLPWNYLFKTGSVNDEEFSVILVIRKILLQFETSFNQL
jgi:hypothetical protein